MKNIQVLVTLLLAAGCGNGGSITNDASTSDVVTHTDGNMEATTTSLRFEVVAGDAPVECGVNQPGFGVGSHDFKMLDLRFYVHAVVLHTENNESLQASLSDLAPWQARGVGMIDFENNCSNNGTAPMNSSLTLSLTSGSLEEKITHVSFLMGVPFEYNHVSLQSNPPSPLNLTGMFWGWRDGYKYLQFEGETTAGVFAAFHLGETGCMNMGGTYTCENSNRAEIKVTLPSPVSISSLGNYPIKVDIKALLSEANLGANQVCQSVEDLCTVYFPALGMPFGTETDVNQRVFKF